MREVYWILGGLLAALTLASVVGFWLERRAPASDVIGNLNARIRSWWALIAIGSIALLAGEPAIVVLFAVVSGLAVREFFKGVRMLPLAVVVVGQYASLACGWRVPFLIWVPLWCLAPLAKDWAVGLLLCVFGLSHVPALAMLPISGYEGRTPLLMAFVVVIAQASDVLQYVWGKLLGRHQVLPVLSPSKTWEGLLGGVASVTLLGAAMAPVTPFTPWQAAGMALLIAVSGFASGALLSAIKRRRGLKDWGELIGGHGGVLDRVDSLCLAAPVFFYTTWLLFTAR